MAGLTLDHQVPHIIIYPSKVMMMMVMAMMVIMRAMVRMRTCSSDGQCYLM